MSASIRVIDTKAHAKAAVVEEAKRVLAMAERGEIVDLCWSAAKVDGSVLSSFTATEDAHRRIASVSRLLHRLHLMSDEQAE